ncbi:sugar-binding protein [Cohnella sp. 56]|uniref:sugar-binding protein n=1 Tax=Cohnella sp. 56 TaxID=3113722 RepID=UPI0030EAFF99
MKKWKKTAGLALSMLIAWPTLQVLPGGKAEAATQPVYDVTVSGVDQQTVKGWGVFPSWNRADWNRDFTGKTGAHQALFEDLGATMYRITVPHRAGDADGNLVEVGMQEIYTIIDIAKQHGMEDYMMSVWSPPIGMKTLPTVNGWTGSEHVRLRPEKEGAYTDYLVKVIQDLVARGASVPKALSFQNEPLSQIISEWCYWGGDNGTQYQRVAKMLRAKLDTAGFEDVQILGPEGAAYYENELLLGQNFSALSSDAELYDAIDGLTSHSYFAKGYDNDASYKSYADVVKLFPEKDKWQTEYSTLIEHVSEMDMAINAAERLSSDMALIGNNYWFWWLGWALNRHPTDVGEVLLDGDGVTVTKSKAFYVLSNIFNNVPVGSKVRRVSADPASGLVTKDAVWMDAVAFVDGTKTVALLVNPTGESKRVNVKGLTGATAEAYQLTSAVPLGDDMPLAAARNIQGGTAADIALPAKSVTVIVTSDTDTAPPHIAFDQSDSTTAHDAGYAVRASQFTVSGHLDEPGTLQINGQPVTVGADLSFGTTVTLSAGMNTITAVATDALNNQGPPVQLRIRYDPTYLGLTLDHEAMTYTRQSAFTVAGRTNGSATVNIKHEHGGMTVTAATYQVGSPDGDGSDGSGGHPAGELIRQIFDDAYIRSSYNVSGGLSTAGGQIVRDPATTLAPAEGAYSARLKMLAGFYRIGFTFINTSNAIAPEDFSAFHSAAGLQFWVYTRSKVDSFSAVVASAYNGTFVEARVPLSNYLSAGDYGNKWVKVTIPLSAFDAAAHYGSDGTATAEPLSWNAVRGVGFSSESQAAYSPNVDDVKIVYTGGGGSEPSEPSEPVDPSSLEFSADLNLLVGDNSVTASVYNGMGQTAAPSTIHIVYDPNPPVLTVPSAGETSGTSYVLNGSVNENANVTVNGVAATLKPDLTFTSVVPVGKGANAIVVVATDPAGNVTQAVVNVTSDPVDDGALTPGVTVAQPAAAAPVIDGELNEAGWTVNNRVEKMITGTSDNNLTFGSMWDDDNLYVAVKVLDVDLKNDSAQAYQDDSVELYIDGDNSRGAVYGTDDHQITLGWHDTELSVGGDIAGIQFAQHDITGGFTVEFAIPWSGIGIDPPVSGSVIGFDVAYNDDDGHNGGNRESQLMWRGNGDNWRSTSAFGSLILGDGRNIAVALTPSGALTIDGALDEPYWALRSSVTKNITGTSNNSVTFGTLSDLQNLYVGIRVLDSELKNDSAQNYQDDSVELYLDADHNRGAAYDAKDHQLTVRWHDNQLYMIGELDNVQFAQTDINGGYTVEFAIPWASLGVTPYRDIMLGLDVGNNDDDGHNGGSRESQLMWNGTANNWRDTSAFGDVLNHNLSLPLPDNTAPEPEGLTEFADHAADLTKLYDKTSKIVIATGHPEYYDGDADRMAHNIDNPPTPEYVVYKSPEGDIYSFDIGTGLFSNTPQFTFYGSADGVTYTKITPQSTLQGGSAGYATYSNKASGLPAGTKYLKIEFPGLENWKEQLLNVTFKYFGETTQPPGNTASFVDDAADLTKLFAKSANLKQVTRTGALDKWGGDGTQYYHSNDDALQPEFIVYQSPEGDIRAFDITVTDWTGLPDSPTYTVFGSGDGVEFTQIPIASEIISTNSGYDTLRIAKDNLPAGYTYLKVVFPYGSDVFDNWTSTINKVQFDYEVASEPNPDPGVQSVSATATLTGPASAASGQAFDVTFGLTDVEGSIAAEDVTVSYDASRLELEHVEALKAGFDIAGQSAGAGTVRLLLAASGTGSAVDAEAELLRLEFRVKASAPSGTATVSVGGNVITNSLGEEASVAAVTYSLQVAVGADPSALTAQISAAQSIYDAAATGTEPGQYPASAKSSLQAAIQAAQAVADDDAATQQQIDAAAAALQTAVDAFALAVNRIGDGDLNEDGRFTVGDLGIFVASYYGKSSADPDWDDYAAADMDHNNQIDIVDLAMLASKILA